MKKTMAAVKRVCVFCYGSNGVEQVRSRCRNAAIKSEAARLIGWRRVFAGKSRKWDDGGVASIVRVGGVAAGGETPGLAAAGAGVAATVATAATTAATAATAATTATAAATAATATAATATAATATAAATPKTTQTSADDTIFGSVVWLSLAELELLDQHEGCYEPRTPDPSKNRYYRQLVQINLGTGRDSETGASEKMTEGEVYVRTSHEWECVFSWPREFARRTSRG